MTSAMTHISIWSAVVLAAAVWPVPAGVCAEEAVGQRRPVSGVLLADAGSTSTGGTASNAGAEPMVAPVKRVAPKTPVFTHGVAGGTTGKEKSAQPIVPERPNCDPGFKVDGTGKGCMKVAGGDTPKSEKKKKPR
jgi:hypothetical protein